jgi:4-hydroxybenzoate polyprenyltransferase
MDQIKIFIELIRLKKPIGYMLLFWPCAWGLTLAYDFDKNFNDYFLYLLLFLSGSILMRSAGCIVNDIFDKKFDQKVTRTKNRPIASGKVSVNLAIAYSVILCFLAFIVLINFNKLTIILAICSMPLAFTYPLMKRFTYCPQLFLGITFNYGVILGWTAVNNDYLYLPFIVYFGAIFWTLGYDTIYGYQDIVDDEIIGVKSTSIKFKKIPNLFVSVCYLIFIISLMTIGFLMKLNKIYYLLLMIIVFHLIFYQVNKFNSRNTETCFKIFKSNNVLGFIVFGSILLGKV